MSRPSSFDELLGQLNAQNYGVDRNGSNGSNGNGEVKYCDCEETLDCDRDALAQGRFQKNHDFASHYAALPTKSKFS